MAGVEAEKIVPNTEEKTTNETPNETIQADGSETAPVKDEKPVEVPAAVGEKDFKPTAEEEKTSEVKTV
ncbi:unnamed protein product [Eruca vesicaria subsp. sativa]|uniref:Uncharacterized protein n=1 Tax=Eruca vesicaria subsp. sativa TaxID=29727 RepID=A0ABC8IS41_ERUVS|nr:unnamed protein product [Eruca vesicaria subsp. sativa]